jgi:hypothetical protein
MAERRGPRQGLRRRLRSRRLRCDALARIEEVCLRLAQLGFANGRRSSLFRTLAPHIHWRILPRTHHACIFPR